MRIGFDDPGTPMDPFVLQRAIGDALTAVQAGWDQEHNADGTHGTIGTLTVSGDATIEGAMIANGAQLFANTDTARYGVTLTATTHDLALPDGRPIYQRVVKIDMAADRTLTGIVPIERNIRWQELVLINGSNFALTVPHNSGSSTFPIHTPTTGDLRVASGCLIRLLWDAGSGIWRTEVTGMVKTIQRGTIAFTNGGSDSPTATITAVNTATSALRNLGFATDSPALVSGVRIELTNSTTITAARFSSANAAVISVGYEVTEWA